MQNLSSNISTQALFTKGGTFGQRAEEASTGAQAIVKKTVDICVNHKTLHAITERFRFCDIDHAEVEKTLCRPVK